MGEGDDRGRSEVWVFFGFRIPPTLKKIVERIAFRDGISQSELARRAVREYVVSHSTDEWERKAAKIATRREKEMIKLAQPKDGYRTEMQVKSAWDTIVKQRAYAKKIGVYRRASYGPWIRRLEENVESIDEDNPEGRVAIGSLQILIEKLEDERDSVFQEMGDEDRPC